MKTEKEIRKMIVDILHRQKADGFYDDFGDGQIHALKWVLEDSA